MKSNARVSFLFATILLDALGIGLLVPILPDILRRFSTDPAFVSRFYGYFISSYSLLQFLASPVLGALSDRFGRRPVLLVSLLGSAIDYMFMAFSPTLWILFIGRLVSGLTGASMTVASAYMADISDDSNRSVNFGMIGAAWGVGFIIGPSLGGLLVGFGWQIPFYVAAALNLGNFAFGYFILPESLSREHRRNVDLKKINPFRSIRKLLQPSPILFLIWIHLLLSLAGQVHPSNWTLYTQLKFGWTAFQVGLSISFIGIGIALVQGGLTRIIIPRFGEWKILAFSLVLNMFSYAAFAFASAPWMLYVAMIPAALSGVCGPALQSLIARSTRSEEQGELQGTLMSLVSLVSVLGPLFYTALFTIFTKPENYFPGIAYLSAALICLFSIVLFSHFSKRKAVL